MVVTGLLIAVIILDIALKIGRSWVLSLLCGAEEHRHRLTAVRQLLAAPLTSATAEPVQDRLEQIRASSLLRNRFLQQWIFERIDLPFVILYLLVMAIIGGWLVVIPLATALLFYNQALKAASQATAAIERRYAKQEFPRRSAALSASWHGNREGPRHRGLFDSPVGAHSRSVEYCGISATGCQCQASAHRSALRPANRICWWSPLAPSW